MNLDIRGSKGVETAAADNQGGSSEEAGLGGSEETDGSGNIFWFADCALNFFHTTFYVGVVPEHGRLRCRPWKQHREQHLPSSMRMNRTDVDDGSAGRHVGNGVFAEEED